MLDRIWNRKISGIPMLLVQLFHIVIGRFRDFLANQFWRGNMRNVGKGTKIQAGVTIRYPKNISLSENISVGRHVRLESEYADSECFIGSWSQINRNVKLDFTGGLIIGENVLLSEDVCIYTHSHGADPKSRPAKTPLHIEDDVWVGGHAAIVEGVGRIGRGAMIAEGAVVTKEVSAGMIVGGVPAKVIGIRKRSEEE